MYVLYVRGGDRFAPPTVEIGETVDAMVKTAMDYVEPPKRDEARKALSSKRKWKDGDSGIELEIRGKEK